MYNYLPGQPDTKGHFIAHSAEVVLLVLPTLAVAICSFVLTRRRKDPARWAFLWLRITLILYFAAVICESLQFIFAAAHEELHSRESHDRAADWAEFFRGLSGNGLVLTLVELALGVHYCVANASFPLVRVSAFVYTGIASVVSLVALGGGEKLWSDAIYLRSFTIQFSPGLGLVTNIPTFEEFQAMARPWIVLYGVEEVMLFVAAIAVLALSISVAVSANRKRDREAPRQAIGLLVAAASLNLAMWAWALADAGWRFAGRSTPTWWFAANGLVENWTFLINLFLVLIAGTRKQHGLWSTPQPWMRQGPVVQQDSGPSYGKHQSHHIA